MTGQISYYPCFSFVCEAFPLHIFENSVFACLKSWRVLEVNAFSRIIVLFAQVTYLQITSGYLIIFCLLDHGWFKKLPISQEKISFWITHLKHFQGSFYSITKYLVSRRFINLCEALSLFRGIIAAEPICSLFTSVFHVYLPFWCLAVCGWQRSLAVAEKMLVLYIVRSEENMLQ